MSCRINSSINLRLSHHEITKRGGENLAQKRQQRFSVSPAQVEKSIKGTHFPAQKQDLIQRAKENNANQDVLEVLENMPDKQFKSPVDISKAMGRM